MNENTTGTFILDIHNKISNKAPYLNVGFQVLRIVWLKALARKSTVLGLSKRPRLAFVTNLHSSASLFCCHFHINSLALNNFFLRKNFLLPSIVFQLLNTIQLHDILVPTTQGEFSLFISKSSFRRKVLIKFSQQRSTKTAKKHSYSILDGLADLCPRKQVISTKPLPQTPIITFYSN